MKVLVIEDEQDLADIIKQGLEENSFTVEVCNDGEEGLFMAENYPYDAILLDIMLPTMDGFTVLHRLRAKKVKVPVLVLTARGGMGDKVRGLDTGADDYLVKPFEFPELIARLKSIIRRNKGEASPLIAIDTLTIDINSRTVTRDDKEIPLSAREYRILVYLALNKGRVLSRDQIAEYIYDPDHDLDSNVIDVYISYLRNKIDKGRKNKLIHTIRGEGYTLKEIT
ncbi:MAG: response regulator transcription factor [Nitrospiraceae bacterium]|nr:MAG: response regulator transcription factor [Nitrospiraceae bacterium]